MRVLLVTWFDPNGIKAISDHVNSIRDFSRNKIDVLNTFEKTFKLRKFFRFDLSSYDAVIFHNTITYNIPFLRSLNLKFKPALEDFQGIKVLMKQDEMRRVNDTKNVVNDWRISIITTCLDSNNCPKVYGDEVLKKVKTVHTHTCYVTEEMQILPIKPLEERTLDVVYRGMETPFEWGMLGYEKYIIGEKFKQRASKYNLRLDISSLNKDRIYGDSWPKFLSNSRATLAVESGANIFDFDGSIEEKCSEIKKTHPDISFLEVYNSFLKDYEGKIKYNQISPRHIEATALGTVQIMFEGDYSNIYKPHKHYIPLKKDFSNIDEVIHLLKDTSFCKRIASEAHSEILFRKDLTFDYFVKQLDDALESF